jgi:hypothetical protein
MEDVAVIEDAAAAEVSLDPIRRRLPAAPAVPGSATMLTARVGLAPAEGRLSPALGLPTQHHQYLILQCSSGMATARQP